MEKPWDKNKIDARQLAEGFLHPLTKSAQESKENLLYMVDIWGKGIFDDNIPKVLKRIDSMIFRLDSLKKDLVAYQEGRYLESDSTSDTKGTSQEK